MAPRTWTCQRVSGGEKCGRVNSRRNTYCEVCGKRRPASLDKPSKAKHIKGTYEEYIERQGYEACGICGREPKPGKRLHRDHDHARGVDRGLLDFHCNRQLRTWMTVEWMEAAIAYLKRYEEAA
jgi:hypothetical protein